MNRMLNQSELSDPSRWKLAAAYAILGRTTVARSLLQKTGTNPQPSTTHYSYGSPERDQALLLETYLYMDEENQAFQYYDKVAEALSEQGWMSTQTTAYCLLATSKFLAQYKSEGRLTASVNYQSKTDQWKTTLPLLKETLLVNEQEEHPRIRIDNTGNIPIYMTLTRRGIPFPGSEIKRSEGIALTVDYRDQKGSILDVSQLEQGTSFEATIKVENRMSTEDLQHIALSHIIPSGWEIENTRLSGGGSSNENFDHQDIRDDRVNTYFDLKKGELRTFKLKLTATYAGDYYMPGVVAEAMYDASISASSTGKWIKVLSD